MTNEELYQRYIDGDENALSELYEKNIGMLYKLANTVTAMYEFKNLDDRDELFSFGGLQFTRLLKSKKYDPQKAKLSTYIFKRIKFAMVRYIREFKKYDEKVVSASSIFFSGGLDADSTNTISYYEAVEDKTNVPLDIAVYKKIQVGLLEKYFHGMSSKEKAIIGKYFGVFGYPETSVKEIAMTEIMREDGIYKFIDRTLQKMKNEMKEFRRFKNLWKMARQMCELPDDEHYFRMSELLVGDTICDLKNITEDYIIRFFSLYDSEDYFFEVIENGSEAEFEKAVPVLFYEGDGKRGLMLIEERKKR